MTSRARTAAVVLATAMLAIACSGERPPIARAIAWLRREQHRDGMWRSPTYGLLRRGESTTAALALALAMLPAADLAPHRDLLDRALAALVQRRAPSPAQAPEPIDYPCYTAAHLLHALVLAQPPDWRTQAERLVGWLRTRQLGSAMGWPEAAPEFGGFGLGDREPQHPDGGGLVGLSVTTAVLEAVHAAGLAAEDPLVREARTFVERCQRDAPGDDGSFCFTPTADERASKAGFAGAHRTARGYGTATCDGIRALIASGAPMDSPRVARAFAWLAAHMDRRVPGLVDLADATIEPSLRLYWFATLAAVARRAPDPAQAATWAALATAHVLAMQRTDGSFVGLAANMKEDDPLVATALALAALGGIGCEPR